MADETNTTPGVVAGTGESAVDLDKLSYPEYERYRTTGELPAPKAAPAVAEETPPARIEPDSEPDTVPQEPEEDDDEGRARTGKRDRKIERQAKEIEELKRQLQAQPRPVEKPPEPPAGKPQLRDFETLEAYQEALTNWTIDQREQQREAEKKQKAVEAEDRKLQTDWKSKQSEARKTYPDYDNAVYSVPVPQGPGTGVIQRAVLEDPNGAKVLYWLAKNPDHLKRITELSPVSAVRELGRISAAFDDQSSANGKSPPKTSSAPPPPPSISRPSKTGSDSIYDERMAREDYPKWLKVREAQLRK